MKAAWFYIRLSAVIALFQAGAFILGVCVFPFVIGSTVERRQRRRRTLAGAGMQWFLSILGWVGLLDITILNREELPSSPAIIIANHPTLFDALILQALVPNSICIAKRSLRRHPAFALSIYWLGYLTADLGVELMEDAIAALSNGATLVVFPEGTRSTSLKAVDRFQRGAVSCAVRAGVPICPVLLRCNAPILGRKEGIFESVPQKYAMRVEIKPPLPVVSPPPERAIIPGLVRDMTAELEKRYAFWLSLPLEH